MTYEEALAWIHGRLKLGSRPGLIRVEALLDRLGNPHKGLPAIHVAGTNGKGSTVAFLNSLLSVQGLKVGTFTSPYITRFNERIGLNGEPISDDALVALVMKIKPLVEELDQDKLVGGITEFELVTVMMFSYFKEQQVDVALIEVGLGGLLDSTNVIEQPIASVITTIGMDHMDILGDTIEKIAYQKAGIIKKHAPIIVGDLPLEALVVMEDVSEEKESEISVLGEQFRYMELGCVAGHFDFSNENHHFGDLFIPLKGHHQFANASVAIETLLTIAPKFNLKTDIEMIQKGLNQVTWPGRMEVMSTNPLIIIDGAHNEPAIGVLINNIHKDFSEKKVKVLFAAINTKDVSSMLLSLKKTVNQDLFITTFDYPTALGVEEYPEVGLEKEAFKADWQEAIKEIKESLQPEDVFIITGSLYFISQVRNYLL